MILVSDANVLIHLGHVGGLWVLPKIAATEVLDVILQECHHPSQPTLVPDIQGSGVQVVQSELSWILEAQQYHTAAMSAQDSLNLHYAKAFGRVLLTNDGPLRRHSNHHGVAVHGTIWILEEAARLDLVPGGDLCEWIRLLSDPRWRLPLNELHRVQAYLGC